MLTISKSTMFFTTAGIVGGVFYAFKKNQNTTAILTTGAIFGACGFLVGAAINKLYE